LALCFCRLHSKAQHGGEDYSRSQEFNRMVILSGDIKAFADQITFYNQQNFGDTTTKKPNFLIWISYSNGDYTKTIHSLSKLKRLVIAEPYSEFNLNYTADKRAISQIEMRLNNYHRTLTVSGTDTMKVDALFLMLSTHLKKRQTSFGATYWTSFFICFVFLLLATSGALLAKFLEGILKKEFKKKHLWLALAALIFGILPFQVLLLSVQYMPGFILVNKVIPFWDRDGQLLLNLVGIFLTIFFGKPLQDVNGSTPTKKESLSPPDRTRKDKS